MLIDIKECSCYNKNGEILCFANNKKLVRRDKIKFKCKKCKKEIIKPFFSFKKKYFQQICNNCYTKTDKLDIVQFINSLPIFSDKKIYNIDNLEYIVKKEKLRKDSSYKKQMYVGYYRLTRTDRIEFLCTICNKRIQLNSERFLRRRGEKKICTSCYIREKKTGFKHSAKSIQKMKESVRARGVYINKWVENICKICDKKFKYRKARAYKRVDKKYCSEKCRIKAISLIGSKNAKYGYLGPLNINSPSKPELKIKLDTM